jgi:hypothetical protein
MCWAGLSRHVQQHTEYALASCSLHIQPNHCLAATISPITWYVRMKERDASEGGHKESSHEALCVEGHF